MSTFAYTARDETGKTAKGVVQAGQELDAIANLQRQGLLVLSIKEEAEAKADAPASAKKKFSFFSGGIATAEVIFLAEQLALLLKGGIPLLQGIKLLGQNVGSPELSKILDKVAQDVAAGSSFHAALAKHPKVFDDVWQAMVEGGEASGQLPKTLEEVCGYMNQRDALKSKIISAFMYPCILIGLSVGVLIFFIVKIVPIFANIFESFHLKLPLITQIVVTVSAVMAHDALIILGTVAAIVVALKAYLRTENGQWTKSRVSIKVPIFGNFILNMLTERFLVNFALLLKSGVDVINVLTILERLFSSNKLFASAVARGREKIKGGGTISQGFSETKTLPNLVNQMIRVGEESGRLPEILETLSVYYRRQIEQFVSRLSSVIDPIMVLGVGVLVTIIVLAVFMPIFQLSQIGGMH